MVLGNPNNIIYGEDSGNGTGNNRQTPFAVALFVLGSFILCIHLLNMLIAIMGDVFLDSNESKEKLKMKEQLRLCLDKWKYNEFILGSSEM